MDDPDEEEEEDNDDDDDAVDVNGTFIVLLLSPTCGWEPFLPPPFIFDSCVSLEDGFY